MRYMIHIHMHIDINKYIKQDRSVAVASININLKMMLAPFLYLCASMIDGLFSPDVLRYSICSIKLTYPHGFHTCTLYKLMCSMAKGKQKRWRIIIITIGPGVNKMICSTIVSTFHITNCLFTRV